MKNLDIRSAATEAGLSLWQLADILGISDSQLSRKLRYELSDTEKQNIFEIIKNLAKEDT